MIGMALGEQINSNSTLKISNNSIFSMQMIFLKTSFKISVLNKTRILFLINFLDFSKVVGKKEVAAGNLQAIKICRVIKKIIFLKILMVIKILICSNNKVSQAIKILSIMIFFKEEIYLHNSNNPLVLAIFRNNPHK